ncbi:MAG TPA: MotA/TolQ/ExbB proton channel family protein [Vicinamibacterales bacterium]|nr:MotA/TolQ/ExbB proton channel family protein [Vicinamibacterales bacterium]
MSIDILRDTFHQLAGLLVWPVLISLLLLAGATLFALGGFLREALDRRAGRFRRLARDCERLQALLATRADDTDLEVEELLQATERKWWNSLGRLRLAVRVGPTLGLMGTLIPMANALQGLAEGNLPTLASNMVTAFAATVIGLTISVVAYLLTAAREEWVRADLQALAFHAERLSRSGADRAA